MIRRVVPLLLLSAAPALYAQGLPSGWMARPDRGDASGVHFISMGPGFHVHPGTAAVLYRESDKVTGKFHAVVKFVQTQAPTHPEGYGMFFGGSDLQGPNQQYTYFLVRGDGKYLVKTREGDETSSVVGWTDSDAIVKQDADGKCTNTVEIDATGAKVAFKVNGKVVYEMDAPSRDGIVGLRINHNLDLHLDGFGVHQM
jgi:hypothetical protein